MTFKHVKFGDSPTMRALEKVAQEKGLIKPDPIQKVAEKKLDTTISSNLMENIFKLCAGLREQGFQKEAAELEVNFFNFKRAQTLYETSKEKGEDVIQFAHPKGSHKLEGVEGEEATVEDILDKHVKILQKIEKMPTGKLSSAAHVMREVKKALAQDQEDQSEQKDEAEQEAATKYFTDLIGEVTAMIQSMLTREDLSDFSYQYGFGKFWGDPEAQTGLALKTTGGHFESLQSNLNDLIRKGASLDSVNQFKANLNSAISLVNKASNISGLGKANYLRRLQSVMSRTDNVLKILRGEMQPPKAPGEQVSAPVVTHTEVDPLFTQGQNLISRLKGLQLYPNVFRNTEANNWVNKQISSIQDILDRINKAIELKQMDAMRPDFTQEIETAQKYVQDFDDQVHGRKTASS